MRRPRLFIQTAMLAAMLVPAICVCAARAADRPVRIATALHAAPALPAVFRSGSTFDMVGGRWSGGPLQVRASMDGHTWTRWVPLVAESPTWTGNATRVELRRTGGGAVRDLRLSFIASPPAAVSNAAIPAVALRPPIITRAGWGANEALRRAPPSYAPALKMVFVHHTDTATLYSCADSARIIRGIYAYHVLSNGWNDIGYNFLIDRCGRIFEGRAGGVDRPVIGAQTLGMNTGSAGIAMIGTFTTSRPTPAAMGALERLIAWRLDVAHVNPLSKAYMISAGNEYFHPGQGVWLRAVSGHRDGSATSCPGAALYALLPAVARAAAAIGLPKIYSPRASGGPARLGPGQVRPIAFRAGFSHATSWTSQVLDPAGRVVAMRVGTGTSMSWMWNGLHEVLPAGTYRWTVSAPGALAVNLPLGVLGQWARGAPPVSMSGSITSGSVADLLSADGQIVQATDLEIVDHLPVTAAQFAEAGHVGVHLTDAAGGQSATLQLWNYDTSAWVDAGTCSLVAGKRCDLLLTADNGAYGRWDTASSSVEMRARFTADQPLSADFAATSANG